MGASTSDLYKIDGPSELHCVMVVEADSLLGGRFNLGYVTQEEFRCPLCGGCGIGGDSARYHNEKLHLVSCPHFLFYLRGFGEFCREILPAHDPEGDWRKFWTQENRAKFPAPSPEVATNIRKCARRPDSCLRIVREYFPAFLELAGAMASHQKLRRALRRIEVKKATEQAQGEKAVRLRAECAVLSTPGQRLDFVERLRAVRDPVAKVFRAEYTAEDIAEVMRRDTESILEQRPPTGGRLKTELRAEAGSKGAFNFNQG